MNHYVQIVFLLMFTIFGGILVNKIPNPSGIEGIEDCMMKHIKPNSTQQHYRVIKAYCKLNQ